MCHICEEQLEKESFIVHPSSSLPLDALATDSVPLVSDFSHQVVQFLGVCRQLSFVPHGLPRPHGGVINRLLRAQRFLELLSENGGEERHE